ncbi:MAG: hypothetical protein U0452_13050 [Anaerolineae bacterium]
MAIDVEWYGHSDRIILMHFHEDFSWDEFYEAKQQADLMMDSVDHNCALVLWFPTKVPPLTNALSNGRAMLSRRHPRSERFIIVSQSSFVRSLGSMLGQIVGPRATLVEVAATPEEADIRLAKAGYLEPA